MKNETNAIWEISLPCASSLSSKEFALECWTTSFVFCFSHIARLWYHFVTYYSTQSAQLLLSVSIDWFIYFVVDAFYSQIWSQETHLTLAAVLIPSYGLLTQKIPRCFIIAVSHFSAAWHAGRSMQHVKPLWNVSGWSQTWAFDFTERISGDRTLFHNLEIVGTVGPCI